MSDLIERFRKLQADTGIPHLPTELTYECRMAVSGEGPRAFDWSDKPHRLVYDLSREVERLTAERDAALAKLAQYEQAPVVGWLADDGRISSDETKRTAMAQPSRDAFHIPLIAQPEATHDST